MKRAIELTALLLCLGPPLGPHVLALVPHAAARGTAPAQEARKLPDAITLGADAKIGPVAFSHANHATKNYNISGDGPIACVECHHTAQPASEVAKHPPLKTAWPLDRTTTLTAELLEKDQSAVGVIACRSCHARAGAKPAVWPEIPQIKHESSAAMITLTNQQAFHRNCAACHDEVAKHRPDVKAPTTQKCMACHKKA
jgi:hypothetical protein